MKERESFMRRITDAADLGAEPLPKLPLVEILGDNRVLIENHCGITAYSQCEICVKVKFGLIQVTGSRLHIARMTLDQLLIAGVVDGVSLYKGR